MIESDSLESVSLIVEKPGDINYGIENILERISQKSNIKEVEISIYF